MQDDDTKHRLMRKGSYHRFAQWFSTASEYIELYHPSIAVPVLCPAPHYYRFHFQPAARHATLYKREKYDSASILILEEEV